MMVLCFLGKEKKNAAIAQMGERQTEDVKVPGFIPGLGTFAQLLPVLDLVLRSDDGPCLVRSSW